MKKIKDFIYNISDIVVALVILVVACGVIFWRMDAIIDYPATVVGEKTVVTEPVVTEPVVTDPIVIEEPEPVVEEPVVTDPIVEEPKQVYINGKLAEDMTVKVAGSTATQAIQCLVEVGIFDDFDDFKKYAKEAGKDCNSVKGGKITFKAGSTKKQIANQMTYK